MAFCSACGTKNPDEARFCSACGHALVQPEPIAPPAERVLTVIQHTPPLKAFDNPAELWKMYFYVSFFNIGIFFLTQASTEFLEDSGGWFSIPMVLFVLIVVGYLALAYWLIKKQGVDKNRSLWLLPLLAWQVYGYLDGLSGFDPAYAVSSFDYYDAYISGLPETIILIKLFLALRER
jgi:apolipoprotein N-acyltransferase